MTVYDPRLLDALEALPVQPWRGKAWRHMFNAHPPEKINLAGARWNPPGVGAIYVSMDEATAIAEGDHAIAVQPLRPTRARRVIYELDVDVNDVVDLTAPGALAAVGLTQADIDDDDHAACQRVGGAAAWLGRGGLVVPSARSDGGNLVIIIGPGGDAEIERVSQHDL